LRGFPRRDCNNIGALQSRFGAILLPGQGSGRLGVSHVEK
jgi:hypothetical protein